MSAPLRTVVCRRGDDPDYWTAWVQDTPQVAFDSTTPMEAVRRLLTETDAPAAWYWLRVEIGASTTLREFEWKPVAILFVCDECRGQGAVDGFNERYQCRRCNGRGRLPG